MGCFSFINGFRGLQIYHTRRHRPTGLRWLYRLAYNLISFVTFLPILYISAANMPDKIIWQLEWPISLVFNVIRMVGFVGLLVSLLQTDPLRFAGLGQAIRFISGGTNISPPPTLVVKGSYRLVRHPLYFFSLIILWFFPVMTAATLAFNMLTTLYFWIGSIFEESRLVRVFGDAYLQYQQEVPRLLPIKIRL